VPVALWWGLVAASSLVIGSTAGVIRDWNRQLVGLVLGFGAGALVSSISFELAEEGFRVGGALPVSLGLAAGAVVFYLADKAVGRMGSTSSTQRAAGLPLALGALLDGIPEQAVLGIGIAGGAGVSLALVLAIFVSNLPESIGSASDMKAAGHPPRRIVVGWVAVALLCAAATVGGYQLQEFAGTDLQGGIDGFAAGALLVMLVGSMIPEATEKAREQAGLAAVLGFAVAAGLSLAS
jgi:ZIP family zinc transporter